MKDEKSEKGTVYPGMQQQNLPNRDINDFCKESKSYPADIYLI